MRQIRTNRRVLLRAGAGAAALSALGGAAFAYAPRPSPVVRTSNGPIQGLIENDVHVFKGVRYGAPPVGALRFKPPQKPAAWTATETALNYGAPAVQMGGGAGVNPTSDFSLMIADIFSTGSDMKIDNEDCLFLNVWSKGLDAAAKRPVMVWLHGGGFAYGSGGWPVYDGANLARRGDVVVITVNHRLNVFGYLDLSGVGGAEYAQSDNACMLDLVLMLEWVRDNAAAFGGDPGNVTIFGESGGGAKVSALCAMPAARGLFHKAIIESGPGVEVGTAEQTRAAAGAILSELNITAANLGALQTLTTDQIMAGAGAAMARAGGGGPGGGLRLGPTIDGVSLTRHPFSPDAPAISRDVPILIGWNKDEMSIFNASSPWWGRLTEEQLIAQMGQVAGPKAEPLLAALRAEFPGYSPTFLLNAAMTTSFMFGDSVRLAERKAAQRRAPVYMYNLVWDTPAAAGLLKSPHTLEIPFVFDNIERAEALVGRGDQQRALADQMSNAWIAFARTGSPHHAGLPEWPRYDARRRATMLFDATPRVVNDPIGRVRQVLHSA